MGCGKRVNKFDPSIHHRRSIRLKGYDYSQASAYGDVILNEYGRVIEKWWHQIPDHFPNVETQTFVIMPNHIHGIIAITNDGRGAVTASENGLQKQGERTSPYAGQHWGKS